MDTLTSDVLALLDHLGLGAVHYVGLSMGGYVGMRLAARHPERVLSLTLLDTGSGPEDADKVSRYRLLANVYRVVGPGPLRRQVEPLMFGPTIRTDPAGRKVLDQWFGLLKGTSRAGIRRAVLGVVERTSVDDELGDIRARTLVAVGADDISQEPYKSEALAAAIAGAKLEIVPDAGHSSTIEQPAVLTRLIREHLEG